MTTKKVSLVTAATAAVAFLGLGLVGVSSANAYDPTYNIPSGGTQGMSQNTLTKKVQISTTEPTVSNDGSVTGVTLSANQSTAYPNQYLVYTVNFTLDNSVNLSALQLLDANGVVVGGYGTYDTTPGAYLVRTGDGPAASSTGMAAGTEGTTIPSFTGGVNYTALTPSSSGSLVANLPVNGSNHSNAYTGIADGTYKMVYVVKVNNAGSVTTGNVVADTDVHNVASGVTTGANPAGEVGGVKDVPNTIDLLGQATPLSDGSCPVNTAKSGSACIVDDKNIGGASPDTPGTPGDTTGGNGNTAEVNILATPKYSYDVYTTACKTDPQTHGTGNIGSTDDTSNPNDGTYSTANPKPTDDAACTGTMAGSTVNMNTTFENTGNMPFNGIVDPGSGVVYPGDPTAHLSVPTGGANLPASYTTSTGVTATNITPGTANTATASSSNGSATLTVTSGTGAANLAPGAKTTVTYTENTIGTDPAGMNVITKAAPVTPTSPATGATFANVGTDIADGWLTVTALTPTGAILMALKNNAGPFIGIGAVIVAIGVTLFLLVSKRRKEQEQQATATARFAA